MRSLKIILGLFIFIILIASATYAQKQFTHTVTAENKYCNATCSIMDVPELNDNPSAIILVIPSVENGRNLNPHPVGVFYVPFSKKWSITNTDGTAIAEGAKFDVQYDPRPDSINLFMLFPNEGRFRVLITPVSMLIQVHKSDFPRPGLRGVRTLTQTKLELSTSLQLANGVSQMSTTLRFVLIPLSI